MGRDTHLAHRPDIHRARKEVKFAYGYKTSKNETCSGVIDAPSREAVYQKLKDQGIRPFKVELAPGFFNHIAAFGKRTYALLAVVVALVASSVAILTNTTDVPTLPENGPVPRHQIYGDPALMERMEKTLFASVFDNPGDRILARYAQPGFVDLMVPHKEVKSAAADLDSLIAKPPELFPASDDGAEALGDPREVNELKRIVLSMRAELSRYLANGVGTTEQFVRRLNERQKREAQIYTTAKAEIEKSTDITEWNRINDSLRAIGLKTIPEPASLADGEESLPGADNNKKNAETARAPLDGRENK